MIEIAGGILLAVLILVLLPAIASGAVAIVLLVAVASAAALVIYALPEVGEPLATGAIVAIVLGSPFWGLLLYDRMSRRREPRWHL
jgi:hypothetical protein